MIRFILKRSVKDSISGWQGQQYETIDGDLDLLERALTCGGTGEDCYDRYELIGAEVMKDGDA